MARLLEFLKDDYQTLTVVFDQLIIFKTVFLDFESIWRKSHLCGLYRGHRDQPPLLTREDFVYISLWVPAQWRYLLSILHLLKIWNWTFLDQRRWELDQVCELIPVQDEQKLCWIFSLFYLLLFIIIIIYKLN